MQKRSIVEVLIEDEPTNRLAGVAECFDEIESCMRAVGLVIAGLATKAEGESLRDLLAAQKLTADYTLWLSANVAALVEASATPHDEVREALH